MGRTAFCVVNYFILMASKYSGYIEKIKKKMRKNVNEQKSQSKSRK